MTDYVTDYVRHAGQIKRYHAWPTIQIQTVGEHSWQVALIYEKIFGELSSPVERFIRLHDVAELVVGDPPFPVKANNPTLKAEFDRIEIAALKAMGLGELPDLPIDEKRRIKICDLLEMTLFGMGERELGNMLAIPIIVRTREAALRLTDLNDYPLVYGFLVDAERRHMEVLNQREGMTSDR